MLGEGTVFAGNSSCASLPGLIGWLLGTRQRKSHAEGQAHSRWSISVARDTQADTRAECCSARAPLFRARRGLGGRCIRRPASGPGDGGPRTGPMQPADGPTNVQVVVRSAAGLGSRPGRRGRVDRRGGTGWDVTSGALCILGIPGPRRLVPVHSAAEPGGGGERGARGREARRWVGGRASEERGEKRRERPRGHRPDTLLLPPPPSRL